MRKASISMIVAVISAICNAAITNSEVSVGTVLLDDCTSKSRVVWDAYLNASGRVHSLIQSVSPKADFSSTNQELEATIGLAITNLQDRLTSGSAEEGLVVYKAHNAELAERALNADSADNAGSAGFANIAAYARNIGEEYSEHRSASSVFNSIDSNSNSIQTVSNIAIATAMSITNKIPVMPWRIISSPYGNPNISGAFVQWKPTGWDVMANIPAYGTQSIVNSPKGKIDDLEVRWNPNEWAYGNDEYSLVIERSYTNALGYASPDSYVKWTRDSFNSNTALTVGDRYDGQSIGQNSFASGTHTIASGDNSISLGYWTWATRPSSSAMGAVSSASNNNSFVWNGEQSVRYGSRGIGTFSINPRNGEFGFWIGNKNLYQIFTEWATASSDSTVSYYIASDNDDNNSVTTNTVTYTPIDIVTKDELDTAIGNIHIPEPNLEDYAKKDALNAVSNDAQIIYRLFTGSNVVDEVTNYNSVANLPSRRLYQLNESNVYHMVWNEMDQHTNTLGKAKRYAEDLGTNFAPKAWSKVTSGLGVELDAQYNDTTWISTPKIVFAGGLEYSKVITTYGNVYVLSGNGMTTFQPNTNSYFTISTEEGEELFSIQKTDDMIIPIDASGISVSGNVVVVPINAVSSQPIMSMCLNIREQNWMSESDDGGIPSSIATSSWSHEGDVWINTITLASPVPNAAFFKYSITQAGSTVIKNNVLVDLSQGIIVNGTKFMPTVSGTAPNRTLTWQEVQ